MKKLFRWFALFVAICLCALTIYGYVWIRQYQTLADDEPDVVLSPDLPDVLYCTQDGVPLKLDLYFPKNSEAPWQLLVYVHGGSFTSGDKRKGSCMIDLPAMTSRGYAVAALNYRLMPQYPFPAEVVDAKCAIRFLRAHANLYQLKTEKIGIWGGSAGGHLSAMVGLTSGDSFFEVGEYLDQSSSVNAVVEMFGPMDLTLSMDWLQRLLLRRAFGTDSQDSELLRQASPINYVGSNAPPFLILHGEQDNAVPVEQAHLFAKKLQDSGNDPITVLVKNANHNFKPTGGAISPSRSEISMLMGAFFDSILIGK